MGYYLWDWYGTKTIKYCTDVHFHTDKFARENGGFKRFTDCRKHGIKKLESEIALKQQQLMILKKTTLQDVRPEK